MLSKLLDLFDNIDPQVRRKGALILLISSLVLWPVTAFTVAKDEPQFILGLSWFAITVTCLDVLLTSDVRKQEDEGDGTSG